MYWVYILKSKDDNYYIGQTGNLEQRLNDHISGRAGWTRKRGPWTLVHKESHNSRKEAVRRERYFKSLKSKKMIEQIVQSK